jgi:hypothetical protein
LGVLHVAPNSRLWPTTAPQFQQLQVLHAEQRAPLVGLPQAAHVWFVRGICMRMEYVGVRSLRQDADYSREPGCWYRGPPNVLALTCGPSDRHEVVLQQDTRAGRFNAELGRRAAPVLYARQSGHMRVRELRAR